MNKKQTLSVIGVGIALAVIAYFLLFKKKNDSNSQLKELTKQLLEQNKVNTSAPKLEDFAPKEESKKSVFFKNKRKTQDINHKVVETTMGGGQNAEDLLPNKGFVKDFGMHYSINQL